MAADLPLSPPTVRSLRTDSLPAYLGNGSVGLRVPRYALLDGVAILNGFVGIDSSSGGESFARIPYPLAGDVRVDAARLSDAPERARLISQTYDFSSGELTTRFRFDAGGPVAEVEVLTFCSRSEPTATAQEIRLRVDRACSVVLSAGVRSTGVAGKRAEKGTQSTGWREDDVDGYLQWDSYGGVGTCGLAYMTSLRGVTAKRTLEEDPGHDPRTSYSFRARPGRTYRLQQVTSSVPDALHAQPEQEAVRRAHAAAALGFDALRRENQACWRELWRSRIVLHGASTRWQALVDAAFYYVHASVHTSSPCSTSMFGLAYWPDYHYYRGHVMWDIDTFVVPPLALLQPQLARALLDYRCQRVGAARRNAQLHGYRGAQFPWESAPRSGEEAAPWNGTASAHEHHVSLDVAWALSQYASATHDGEWLRERAWPVIRDVADWIVSRGTFTKRGFEIHRVNGIAERSTAVDNNAYVNATAAIVLREAQRWAHVLQRQPSPQWDRARQRMVVPIDSRGRVMRNHDRYRRNEEKGETPEALAALFPIGFDLPAQRERATIDFYLELADRYVGAPMMSAPLGVFAARAGDRARSLELFERGYGDFVVEPFLTTLEYAPAVFPEMTKAGPFAANMGGFLSACLQGLTGLQVGAGADPTRTWCTRPVTLPRGWECIEVERLWVQGREARLEAGHGDDRAKLTYL